MDTLKFFVLINIEYIIIIIINISFALLLLEPDRNETNRPKRLTP